MKGSYVLWIRVERDTEIRVGRLGRILFSRGDYLYLGSAKRGVEIRVRRHLSVSKRLFWHVDYLLEPEWVRIASVWIAGDRVLECQAAQRLNDYAWLFRPVKGFGCSDCKCSSHLFYSKTEPGRVIQILHQLGFLPVSLREDLCLEAVTRRFGMSHDKDR